ncbi:MAG: hypothetical protein ACK4MF_08380 [Hyphomicrobiaceae bacterium]
MAMSTAVAVSDASAAAQSLAGNWSGGGNVHYGDTRERASCRARFTGSGANFSMNAACATQSGRVDQSASLHKVGPNRYAGSFYNSQYGISGSISISVSGNSMSVNLAGNSGGGSLKLRKN